jgi:hypothetical protein
MCRRDHYLLRYALPKKPRTLNSRHEYSKVTGPPPPPRVSYDSHGHMQRKSLRSRIGYTICLLK